MTNEITETILEGIDQAAEAADWPLAMARAELLLAAVIQNRVAADAAEMAAVAKAAATRATRLVLAKNVSTEPSPMACVWLLKSAAAAAEVIKRGALQPEDGDTRARILDRLKRASPAGLTNSALARACGRSPETISRALRALRQEGAVAFMSVGRAVHNWIADATAVASPEAEVVSEPDVETASSCEAEAIQAATSPESEPAQAASSSEGQPKSPEAVSDTPQSASTPPSSPESGGLVDRNEPPPERNKVSSLIEMGSE